MTPRDPGSEDLPHDDRRKYPRVPLNLLVQYKFNSVDEFLAEYAANISVGGMFLRTTQPFQEGATIFLQFKLADGAPLIEGMGRVVHVNPPDSPFPGMGVEFVQFDEASMQLIEEIIVTRRGPKN